MGREEIDHLEQCFGLLQVKDVTPTVYLSNLNPNIVPRKSSFSSSRRLALNLRPSSGIDTPLFAGWGVSQRVWRPGSDQLCIHVMHVHAPLVIFLQTCPMKRAIAVDTMERIVGLSGQLSSSSQLFPSHMHSSSPL